MLVRHHRSAGAIAIGCVLVSLARADTNPNLPAALRGVNPARISGGLYAALVAEGAYGPPPTPSRARAGYADLSKGRPPAVLDARVGVNIRLGDDAGELPATQRGQAEPHIARSVADPELLLATFQDGRFSQSGGALACGYAVSRDGGLTWRRALIPQLTSVTGGTFLRATDPVAAIGPQGDLYLNTLGSIDNGFGQSAVVVSRSTDSGVTWSAPVVVFQTPNAQTMPDKNWIGVNDFAGTSSVGRLVVSWTNFTSGANGASTGNNIVAAVSDDRGATWSPPVAVTPAGASNQGSLPLFLPDGTLLVIYATFLGDVPQFGLHCKRSLDGGRTFPAPATSIVGVVNQWNDPQLRHGPFLPAAAVARESGDIFVTYLGLVAAGQPRILVTRSADHGATWSVPVEASDQPPGISVVSPAIAVTPDGKTVSVVFMDKRNAPGGQNFVDYYAALSFDGGATWQPNIRLTEMSSDIRYGTPTPTGIMLGDYLGVAPSLASDQPCVAIWCDTRTGDSDPFTVRFARFPQTDFTAWRVARFSAAELRNEMLSGPEADFDHDGEANIIEFDEGTNPRAPDFGETIVLNRAENDSIQIAFLGRSPQTLAQFSVIKAVPDTRPLSTLPSPPPPLASPPAGRVWRTAQVGNVAGRALLVVRATSLPTGIPADGGVVFSSVDSSERAPINSDSRLINLSTRGRSGTGASQLIVGFVTEGGSKSVLLRAIGPTLTQFGTAGALADPRLELIFGSLGQLTVFSVTNDDWTTSPGVSASLFARLGAFALPAASKDSAILQALPPRAYTAVASGTNSGSGITLVEAYDADQTPGASANARFLNLSTRGEVGAGENSLIAGFVVSGTQPRRLLIRAVGPTLGQLGVSGTLADPVLTLFQGSAPIATNDDWEISRSGAAIALTAQRLGAFPLGASSLDAALLITLSPGTYTVSVSSSDGSSGIALVEIYDAD